MTGQVGGVSIDKRPLLTLKPDYVLKPLQADHRGIRELAFYEAIHAATRNQTANAYATFLRGKERKKSPVKRFSEVFDTLAMALSIFLHDPVVMGSEASLREAWKMVKREVDALVRLAKFTPPYYGVVGQRKVIDPPLGLFGLTEEAHLLLQDVTVNFSKPCAIDLKMGAQSYEPDATVEKRTKEYNKYPQQALFGFRIVGMRYYDPSHPNADENGYVFAGKEMGRSLSKRNEILNALRTFFSAGMEKDAAAMSSDLPIAVSAASAAKEGDDDTWRTEEENAQVDHGMSPTEEVSAEKDDEDDDYSAFTEEGDDSEDTVDIPDRNRGLRVKSIANLMQELRSLKRWFDDNESILRFYASSLLVVFEGDLSKTNGSDSGIVTLKMIDFGRVRRRADTDESSVDQGYRNGLRTLHDLLADLLKEDKERQRKLKEDRELDAASITPTIV
jgi:hypothetical protein